MLYKRTEDKDLIKSINYEDIAFKSNIIGISNSAFLELMQNLDQGIKNANSDMVEQVMKKIIENKRVLNLNVKSYINPSHITLFQKLLASTVNPIYIKITLKLFGIASKNEKLIQPLIEIDYPNIIVSIIKNQALLLCINRCLKCIYLLLTSLDYDLEQKQKVIDVFSPDLIQKILLNSSAIAEQVYQAKLSLGLLPSSIVSSEVPFQFSNKVFPEEILSREKEMRIRNIHENIIFCCLLVYLAMIRKPTTLSDGSSILTYLIPIIMEQFEQYRNMKRPAIILCWIFSYLLQNKIIEPIRQMLEIHSGSQFLSYLFDQDKELKIAATNFFGQIFFNVHESLISGLKIDLFIDIAINEILEIKNDRDNREDHSLSNFLAIDSIWAASLLINDKCPDINFIIADDNEKFKTLVGYYWETTSGIKIELGMFLCDIIAITAADYFQYFMDMNIHKLLLETLSYGITYSYSAFKKALSTFAIIVQLAFESVNQNNLCKIRETMLNEGYKDILEEFLDEDFGENDADIENLNSQIMFLLNKLFPPQVSIISS